MLIQIYALFLKRKKKPQKTTTLSNPNDRSSKQRTTVKPGTRAHNCPLPTWHTHVNKTTGMY